MAKKKFVITPDLLHTESYYLRKFLNDFDEELDMLAESLTQLRSYIADMKEKFKSIDGLEFNQPVTEAFLTALSDENLSRKNKLYNTKTPSAQLHIPHSTVAKILTKLRKKGFIMIRPVEIIGYNYNYSYDRVTLSTLLTRLKQYESPNE